MQNKIRGFKLTKTKLKKLTWKHPAELRADLSLSSSSSTCLGSRCDEDGEEKRLILMMGMETKDREDSIDPKVESLTMNSRGGSSPLIDISSTLLDMRAIASTEERAILLLMPPWASLQPQLPIYIEQDSGGLAPKVQIIKVAMAVNIKYVMWI